MQAQAVVPLSVTLPRYSKTHQQKSLLLINSATLVLKSAHTKIITRIVRTQPGFNSKSNTRGNGWLHGRFQLISETLQFLKGKSNSAGVYFRDTLYAFVGSDK